MHSGWRVLSGSKETPSSTFKRHQSCACSFATTEIASYNTKCCFIIIITIILCKHFLEDCSNVYYGESWLRSTSSLSVTLASSSFSFLLLLLLLLLLFSAFARALDGKLKDGACTEYSGVTESSSTGSSQVERCYVHSILCSKHVYLISKFGCRTLISLRECQIFG